MAEETPREAADFYLGAPHEAEYVGTTWDGHPDELAVWSLFQSLTETEFTESTYLEVVNRFIDVTEWPHKYDTSVGTAWSYCWNGGLHVYYQGRQVGEVKSNLYRMLPHRTVSPSGLVTMNRNHMVRRMRPSAAFPKQGKGKP